MKDHELFLSEMGGVTPLKQDQNHSISKTVKDTSAKLARRLAAESALGSDPNPLSTEPVVMLSQDAELAYKKDGVQQGVFKNLRLGKYEIHASLNLHGQTVNQARQQLYQFIVDSHRANLRSLHIQHGKGLKEKQAILKSYVYQWLQNFDQVLAFHSALPQHGGTGAVYVLLKKSDEARLSNKERHQKRGANF